jgi:hypothetical protein
VAHREAEAVGGRERHLVAVQDDVDAGEDRPRVVGRGGDDHLRDGVAQLLRVQLDAPAVLHRRDGREVVGVDAGDGGLVARADELELARAGRQRHLDLLGRQRVHEVAQEAGGHRDRALLFDRGADPAAQRDLEVGGRELEAAIVGREEDVRRDREGAPRRDGPPDDAEPLGKMLLKARDVHIVHLRIRLAGWMLAEYTAGSEG